MTNPEPYNLEIPAKGKKKPAKNSQKLSCSIVENSSEQTGYFDVSRLIDPVRFSQHRGFASDKLDQDALEGFRDELNMKVKQTFKIKLEKRGVVY